MSLMTTPRARTCAAVALALAAAKGVPAHAADQSLTGAVIGAFETIVIDTTKAASKAKSAAKDALAKSKRAKSEESGPETDPAAGDKAAPAEPAKAAGDGDPKTGTVETAKPAGPVAEWPAVEVELAKARCTQLLKGIDAVAIPEPPFRKGDCGAMAPMRLISIGKSPEVSFSPPPIVSCDLIVGLTRWVKDEVQPAAKKHLGSEVIRIESMSDYSCRMAYGRIGNKLSEHGKANALDIRGFTTRKGLQAVVLTDWGKNRRDIAKEIAAAKAAAAKTESAAADTASTGKGEAAEATATPDTTASKLPRKTLAEGLSPKKDKLAVPASTTEDEALARLRPGTTGDEAKGRKNAGLKKDAGLKKTRHDETVAALPGAATGAITAPPPKTPKARFLREIHGSGCRIFGTTLGPEANEAHRNHLHVDMAERKYKKICD
jgi:hypothetical protein